ncbi:hypothetical protein CSW38_10470 [Thermus scotoductus]|uniref:Short-chain dehydrogenase n=2 Tax=Thermus TaxID=270 RepID=A0A430RUS1_THESC|nr:hypothetical protein CSW38_10470 [Thermus scotoductus]
MVTSREFSHTLVVGGTGMLREASVALASRSGRLTSVARTQRSLLSLDAELARTGCVHHLLALDWNVPDRFLAEIERHIGATEPPELVVAWIHEDHLALRLAAVLARMGHPLRFFHVVGSARTNPKQLADSLSQGLEPHPNLRYHQVVLGARRSGGSMRWLTHQEISAGVLQAIEAGLAQWMVGDVGGY